MSLRIDQLRHVYNNRAQEYNAAKGAMEIARKNLLDAIARHPALAKYKRAYVFRDSNGNELQFAFMEYRSDHPVAWCYNKTKAGAWSARPRVQVRLEIDETVAPLPAEENASA